MRTHLLNLTAGGALLAAVLAAAAPPAAAEHVAVKRPVDVPPSADLAYSIKARQKGFSLRGEASISWRVSGARYALRADTRAALFGSILENRSEGAIDGFGIAPAQFYEKRIRREPSTTTFNRVSRSISFTEGNQTYPLIGGEQDRSSIVWQLAATARAAPEKFTPGSQWTFFVAGRRDAEPWTFKVVGKEAIRTGLGPLATLHLVKLPPPDSKEQTLDIWLAPAHEWYPARLRFTDHDDEFVDQTLEKVTRK